MTAVAAVGLLVSGLRRPARVEGRRPAPGRRPRARAARRGAHPAGLRAHPGPQRRRRGDLDPRGARAPGAGRLRGRRGPRPRAAAGPGLLRNSRFRSATTGSLVLGAGMIGMASFVPTLAQVAYGAGLWTCALLVVAWAGSSVVTSLLIRHLPRPLEGARPIAALLVVVAAGLLLATGMSVTSSPYRLVVPMVVSGLATGVPQRAAGSGVGGQRAAGPGGDGQRGQQHRPLPGAACGITLFVTVATHAGAGPGVAALVDGWNTAVLVAAGLTLLGAAAVAAAGAPPQVTRVRVSRRRSRRSAPARRGPARPRATSAPGRWTRRGTGWR